MDIALIATTENEALDLSFTGNDLSTETGLRTAILISLFTDARVSKDELPPGESDQRGYWGDVFNENGDQTGSRLWLLARRKLTEETRLLAEEYAAQALEWLKTDGIAESVKVSASFAGSELLQISVEIRRSRAEKSEFLFDYVWSEEYGV